MPAQSNLVERCKKCGGHINNDMLCSTVVRRCKSGDRSCPYRALDKHTGDVGELFPAGIYETVVCSECGGAICPHCHTTRKCDMVRVKGSSICHMHGAGMPVARGTMGGSPKASVMSTYRFKDQTMQETLEAALESDFLFDTRRELAVVETLLAQAIDQMDTADNDKRWTEALNELDEAEKAIRLGRGDLASYHMDQLRDKLEKGHDAVLNRKQVADLAWQKAQMVEKERKYRLNEGLLITPEAQNQMLEDVLRLLITTINDPTIINRFRYALGNMLRERGYAVTNGEEAA